MKIAFLFPGQGAQYIGMGKDIYNKYEEARNIFEKVSKITDIDIAKLCFTGKVKQDNDINRTQYTQIAIATTSLAILEMLKKENINPEVLTGLSLGEYTALIYGKYLELEDGIKLLKQRGYLMQNFVPKEEFSMVAIIGLDSKIIENICNEIQKSGEFIQIANYNYSQQTVISGNVEAIEKASELLKQKGAKKIIKLNTSGPFHTKKLQQASDLYRKALDNIDMKIGDILVIKNLDGTIYSQGNDIKDILQKHIINPVRFDKTINKMLDMKIDTFIEIGPGKTLTGFIKKENKDVKTYNIYDVETLENTIKEIRGV